MLSNFDKEYVFGLIVERDLTGLFKYIDEKYEYLLDLYIAEYDYNFDLLGYKNNFLSSKSIIMDILDFYYSLFFLESVYFNKKFWQQNELENIKFRIAEVKYIKFFLNLKKMEKEKNIFGEEKINEILVSLSFKKVNISNALSNNIFNNELILFSTMILNLIKNIYIEVSLENKLKDFFYENN